MADDKAKQRRRAVLDLVAAADGVSYRDIARAVGVSTRTAHNDVAALADAGKVRAEPWPARRSIVATEA